MASRTAERSDLDQPVRLRLVEKDLDDHDADFVEIRAQHAADSAAIRSMVAKVLWALMGILISTTTASIMLALNLAVGP